MKTQICFVHVRGNRPGSRIGIVHYLDSGYFPVMGDVSLMDLARKTTDEVETLIDSLNAENGISRDVRDAMEAGSMFGWRVPGAIEALKHFGAPELDATPTISPIDPKHLDAVPADEGNATPAKREAVERFKASHTIAWQ